MDVWTEIEKLQGKTLKTLVQNKPFDVVLVGNRRVIVRPHVSGVERPIRREAIEGAFGELVLRGELTRSEIRERYSNFNPAYVAAILAALPGVTHILKPIRLYYQVE
jgi:hypothetical protein